MVPELRKRVLVLYWSEDPKRLRLAIAHHLRALEYASTVQVVYVNTFRSPPAWLRRIRPDAVLLHTTFLCLRWSHLFPTWKWHYRWLADLRCPKIAMPQDEYDHSEILDEWLHELGVTTILSNFDESARDTLYPIMGTRASFGKALTGYVDDAAASAIHDRLAPIAERRTDIVYRASHLPYWFGSQGQLKHRIGDVVARRAEERGLRTDISTTVNSTIIGDEWLDFLASSKTVIGCESGSSVLDRRGEIRARIRQLLKTEPDLSFDEIAERMPTGWDAYAFFAVSPRHLEAVATKTCQLLVDGAYDGILEAGRHYVPIRRDFSNLDEVLGIVADQEPLQQIADRAYADLVESGRYSYARLADELEQFLREPLRARSTTEKLAWQYAQRLVTGTQAIEKLRPDAAGRILTLPRSVLARSYVAIRLARKWPAHWQLVQAFRRHPNPPVSKRAFLGDMLRLGLIGNARARELNAGELFRVHARIEEDGPTLRFESHTNRTTSETQPPLDADLVTRLRAIVWDHSSVGTAVPYALTPRRWIWIAVGPSGKHGFPALTALAHELPEDVAAALQATISASPKPSRRLARLVRHPHLHGRLVLAVLDKHSRLPAGFLQRYLRDASLRDEIPLHLLAVDLLRLAILERFKESRDMEPRIETTYDVGTGTFVARSVRASDDGTGTGAEAHRVGGALRRIVWDHSRVDTSVPCLVVTRNPPLVSLGDDGVYEFEALNRVAAHYPDDAWRLVSGVTGGPER